NESQLSLGRSVVYASFAGSKYTQPVSAAGTLDLVAGQPDDKHRFDNSLACNIVEFFQIIQVLGIWLPSRASYRIYPARAIICIPAPEPCLSVRLCTTPRVLLAPDCVSV